jgi:hypothetical protein
MPVLSVLFLLAFGGRPVTLAEAAEFAILDGSTTDISSESRFEDFTDILSLCGNFIVVQDVHVLLAHKSIKDFLIAQGTEASPQATICEIQAFIEERCLVYLSMTNMIPFGMADSLDAEKSTTQFKKHWDVTRLQYPLADYACRMWSHHTEAAGITEKLPPCAFFSKNDSRSQLSLWGTWIATQRADIWDNQMALAIEVCKAVIRPPQAPHWSKNFWMYRRARRNTSRSNSSDAGASQQFGKLSSSSDASLDTSSAHDVYAEIYFSIANILIEIALQKPCFPEFKANRAPLNKKSEFPFELESLVPEVKKRMGSTYGGVAYRCLRAACYGSKKTRSQMYRSVVFDLQGVLRRGFRKAIYAQQQSETELSSPLSAENRIPRIQDLAKIPHVEGNPDHLGPSLLLAELERADGGIGHTHGGGSGGVAWSLITSFREKGIPATSTWCG